MNPELTRMDSANGARCAKAARFATISSDHLNATFGNPSGLRG
jgi:hypothetical protein